MTNHRLIAQNQNLTLNHFLYTHTHTHMPYRRRAMLNAGGKQLMEPINVIIFIIIVIYKVFIYKEIAKMCSLDLSIT